MTNVNRVTYSSTLLQGTDKKGVLTPDADGYYTLVLGAYGAYNSAGMFYDLASAKRFFQPASPLGRMLGKGVLTAEYNHPEKAPGMSDQEFIGRVRRINPDRKCAHIRNVHLEEGHRDEQGRPITVVIGEVCPAGPYAQYLEESLKNPHENVYFSVRSLTMDDMLRGVKYTKEIVTWDFVPEGGIGNASKYHSPALESFHEQEVTPTDLWALKAANDRGNGTGMEASGLSYDDLIEELGWGLESHSEVAVPTYGAW